MGIGKKFRSTFFYKLLEFEFAPLYNEEKRQPPFESIGGLFIMRSHFRFSAGFFVMLMIVPLVLSSCKEPFNRPATGTAENSSAESSAAETKTAENTTTPEPENSTATTEKPEDPAATTEKQDSKPDGNDDSKTDADTNAHVHNFVGATCTQAGKCECGAVGTALGHNFTGGSCTAATTCTRCGAQGKALGHNYAAATCTAPSTCTRCKATNGSALGHNYSGGKCTRCGDTNGPLTPEEAKLFKNKLSDAENAEALKAAREIVKKIDAALPNGTVAERVAMAAQLVSDEYYKGKHVEGGNNHYSEAYGVFIKRESSCAGCCRALGLVLSCMGYQWTHVNENQWTHQWIEMTIDGEKFWADGQVGWSGFGSHPLA